MVVLNNAWRKVQSLLFFVLLCWVNDAWAQKKPLEYASLNGWPEISDEKISNDGSLVIYAVRAGTMGNNASWFVMATDKKWQRQLANATQVSITADSRYIVYVKGADSIVVYDPVKDVIEVVLPGNTYRLSANPDKLLLACLHKAGNIIRVYDIRHRKHHASFSGENMELSANGHALIVVKDSAGRRLAKWIDTENSRESVIATGGRYSNFVFDAPARQIAFMEDIGDGKEAVARLRYFKKGMDTATIKVPSVSKGIDSGYVLLPAPPRFNATGTKIFFTIGRKTFTPEKDKNKADVTLWHYNDVYLPAEQSFQLHIAGSYTAVVQADNNIVIQLTRMGNNAITGDMAGLEADFVIVSERYNYFSVDTTAANTPSHYLVNTTTGDRVLLVSQKDNPPVIAPREQFAVWYDPVKDGYYSYEIKTGRRRSITQSMKGLLKPVNPNGRLTGLSPYGIGGWLPGDSGILIYDAYDIWKVDLHNKRQPVNITNGYGRRHKTVLRVWNESKDYQPAAIHEATILLAAFATETRKNGFYKANLQQAQAPVALTMDDCLYYAHARFNCTFLRGYPMYNAPDADVYLLRRSRADQYPELFVTSDFKSFSQLTTLQPEAGYNWMKAELIRYTWPNGKQSAAVLYKPTDFDPGKKYPVIFYIYEKLSYRLHQYLPPAPGDGSLNIPFFVSNGYLICTPDIEYRKGKTGESALEYVTAAARYVARLPYVDATKMGIQGHSFGGYQVNYIVAKSNLFAAAQPSAGASDFISYYNGNYRESSAQFYFEKGQGRIGNTLWEKPELFQQNSPVFYANKVTTPVLIMHNKEDREVPFQQGLEWFTALKRSGKKVWLIQYDKEYHGISTYKNKLDYTTRMKQFFDHYLKGEPQPVWMTRGLLKN